MSEAINQNNFYVYCFINKWWNNNVFYVGKGIGTRYKDFENRSRHIKAVLDHYPCESKILFRNLSEEEAYKKEKHLKETFNMCGYPIIDSEVVSYRDAQRQGIERAKARGVYKGRKAIEIPDFDVYYSRYISRKVNKTQLARELEISRPTLDKLIREYENEHCNN